MSSCWDIVRIKVEQLIIKDSGVARHTRPLRTIASFPSAIHLRPAVCTVRKIMTCHLLEPTKSSLYVVVSFRACTTELLPRAPPFFTASCQDDTGSFKPIIQV
jgi:hypothetical protein